MLTKDKCKIAVVDGKIINTAIDIFIDGKKISLIIDRGIDADDYTCSRIPGGIVSVRRFIRGEEAAHLCRVGRS